MREIAAIIQDAENFEQKATLPEQFHCEAFLDYVGYVFSHEYKIVDDQVVDLLKTASFICGCLGLFEYETILPEFIKKYFIDE